MKNKKNYINVYYKVEGNDFVHAGVASSSIKTILKQNNFEDVDIRRAAISIYEAEMNLVIHAGGGEIEMELDGDKLKVILSDSGPGINDIQLAMREGHSTASEIARQMGFGAGMGLPNIKKHSDSFEINSIVGVGTKLVIEISLCRKKQI